jgi:hypothetical protein
MGALEQFVEEFASMKRRLDAVERQLASRPEAVPMPVNGEKWLTAQELSAIIGKSVNSIYRDARNGKIPRKKVNGSVKFLLSEVKSL